MAIAITLNVLLIDDDEVNLRGHGSAERRSDLERTTVAAKVTGEIASIAWIALSF